MRRTPEALLVAIGGGAVAGATGLPIGMSIPAAAVGVVHGGIAGYRQIYPWRDWRGWVGFLLDHSWALVTSLGSLISHLIATISKSASPVPELSFRQGRHVYINGFRLRSGFMITIGNVISGARNLERESKLRLIKIHETSHVWQTRLFGPIFPVVYAGWACLAGAGALVVGLATRRKPLGTFIENWAYYRNPFEWWAYSREGRWPPNKSGRVWRKPMVRPLATIPSAGSPPES